MEGESKAPGELRHVKSFNKALASEEHLSGGLKAPKHRFNEYIGLPMKDRK
jgi:hypothetical protein